MFLIMAIIYHWVDFMQIYGPVAIILHIVCPVMGEFNLLKKYHVTHAKLGAC